MTDAYLGEVRPFAFNYVPRTQSAGQPYPWALCNGQLLAISQYLTLFAVIGTTYGGDGRTTFAVPNMMPDGESGTAPMGAMASATAAPSGVIVPQDTPEGAVSKYTLGQTYGSSQVTIPPGALPFHNHIITTQNVGKPFDNMGPTPSQSTWLSHPTFVNSAQGKFYRPLAFTATNPGAGAATLHPATIGTTGNGQPHNNMQPYLGLNFCICSYGGQMPW